jgi:hypothetical protein
VFENWRYARSVPHEDRWTVGELAEALADLDDLDGD